LGVASRSPRSPAIQLVCVGRLREPHDRAGREYERRVGQMTTFRVDEVAAEALQRGEATARAREAERITAAIARGAWVVGLTPDGREPESSDAFAKWLERRLAAGRPVAFVVGGASGIDAALVARCDELLALGRLTMPHQLARVVLVEQVYRALCILQGHPYPH
jgi:23S rRNA (pseudouridine1915-N3)-methyltransferase